jgi:hypothetical protein
MTSDMLMEWAFAWLAMAFAALLWLAVIAGVGGCVAAVVRWWKGGRR